MNDLRLDRILESLVLFDNREWDEDGEDSEIRGVPYQYMRDYLFRDFDGYMGFEFV